MGDNMSFKIGYNDLVKIIEAFGFDNFTATIIADYFDNCVSWEVDFSFYIWNTALFNVAVIKGGMKEALEWIDENLCCGADDCTIYVSNELGGVYIEY